MFLLPVFFMCFVLFLHIIQKILFTFFFLSNLILSYKSRRYGGRPHAVARRGVNDQLERASRNNTAVTDFGTRRIAVVVLRTRVRCPGPTDNPCPCRRAVRIRPRPERLVLVQETDLQRHHVQTVRQRRGVGVEDVGEALGRGPAVAVPQGQPEARLRHGAALDLYRVARSGRTLRAPRQHDLRDGVDVEVVLAVARGGHHVHVGVDVIIGVGVLQHSAALRCVRGHDCRALDVVGVVRAVIDTYRANTVPAQWRRQETPKKNVLVGDEHVAAHRLHAGEHMCGEHDGAREFLCWREPRQVRAGPRVGFLLCLTERPRLDRGVRGLRGVHDVELRRGAEVLWTRLFLLLLGLSVRDGDGTTGISTAHM
eukprot:PhM_4_TR6811/c0_g1_i1/m.8560